MGTNHWRYSGLYAVCQAVAGLFASVQRYAHYFWRLHRERLAVDHHDFDILGFFVRSLMAVVLNDTYAFDVSEMVWKDYTSTSTGNVPPPRFKHGAASAKGLYYVFGGTGLHGMKHWIQIMSDILKTLLHLRQ